MASLENLVYTFDEVLMIFAVFLFITMVHRNRNTGKNASSKTLPVPKMERKRIGEAKLKVASKEQCLSDASTTDSDTESVDIKSSSNVEKRPLPPWRQKKGDIVDRAQEKLVCPPEHQTKSLKVNVTDTSWTSPRACAANTSAQMLLCEVWKRSGHPPSCLAEKLYQMLATINIALSPATYAILVEVAAHAGSLERATELSLEMEKLTGSKLPQHILDYMLDLHVAGAVHNEHATGNLPVSATQKLSEHHSNDGNVDPLKDEMVASLVKHAWCGSVPAGQQRHQIFVTPASHRVFVLTMTGELLPKFDQFELTWTGSTFNWGKNQNFTMGSTCAAIKSGVVQWNGVKGGSWQWTRAAAA
eukprot:gnl/MRDRNA2_/MRDRNA2_83857_c1_seq10.p1 gnl/MRDRNA2_/MRDRNA2_83857_c1~~gnl/MRDRNA2_/MRDRNA2_83857_c1_seq10.p1  ORF type:complete len:406 (+),score=62.05 gnl/MRDRNA2_/MRDRNA2_83857_c1_seq10:142-1218(+)